MLKVSSKQGNIPKIRREGEIHCEIINSSSIINFLLSEE